MRLPSSDGPTIRRRLKPFFFAPIPDRTPPVSNALKSVAGKERHLAVRPRIGLRLSARHSGSQRDTGWDKPLMNESLPYGFAR